MGDFGIAPQVYQALIDPTAGGILRERAPRVVEWCERMLDPKASGANRLKKANRVTNTQQTVNKTGNTLKSDKTVT